MRIDHWLFGLLAGVVFFIVGSLLLGAILGNSCTNTLSMRTSYIGSVDVLFASNTPPPHLPESATKIVENPYGLEACDYWPTPWEQVRNAAALVLLISLTGALATRIGPVKTPMRGAVTTGLLCFFLSAPWKASPERLPIAHIVILTTIAAVLGYIGGHLVRVRLRQGEGRP
jgi:hypothetical protein